MLAMVVLLEHRSLVDVIVRGDAMVVSAFGKPCDVLHVIFLDDAELLPFGNGGIFAAN
jgi:hypothetical protein